MFAIALCQLLLECLSFFVSCQTETYFNAKTTTNFKGFSKFAHEQIGSLRNPYSCKHVGKLCTLASNNTKCSHPN